MHGRNCAEHRVRNRLRRKEFQRLPGFLAGKENHFARWAPTEGPEEKIVRAQRRMRIGPLRIQCNRLLELLFDARDLLFRRFEKPMMLKMPAFQKRFVGAQTGFVRASRGGRAGQLHP